MTAYFAMADEAITLAESGQDLLEVAVRDYARLVYRIAYSVLQNAAGAEDAVQEVFLRVLRYGRKLAGVADRKAWLARIAWRVAVEQRRREARAAARDREKLGNDGSFSPAPGAEQAFLDKESGELLKQSIAGLPGELRCPLVLSALEELSPREIGSMLGISEAAVRSRAFRARQILRERLTARLGVGK
ncbi:MAG: RNA polymerase sigma factor [Terriglobales bacterium]